MIEWSDVPIPVRRCYPHAPRYYGAPLRRHRWTFIDSKVNPSRMICKNCGIHIVIRESRKR